MSNNSTSHFCWNLVSRETQWANVYGRGVPFSDSGYTEGDSWYAFRNAVD